MGWIEHDQACENLRRMYEDLSITSEDRRIMEWLEMWDVPTIVSIAHVLEKARSSERTLL